ncbi:peptidyl-prolyl cis-trans isomerase [Babesia caballi]|uniref:Peptidyl-prolyl cis-trans isomerase n=1 Tax=Babesia caballi TaxID=5871 RepID=A0AAV4LYX8_BABCB|nr:peptidyl-prolyl cis-trans isomerase [Babesia caballi]
MGGSKHRHSKDKLYQLHTELESSLDPKAQAPVGEQLPLDFCALSLQPFITPVCSLRGHVFDEDRIREHIVLHGRNPVNGEPLHLTDLVTLHVTRDEDNELQCPLSLKKFTPSSHVVAVKTSGYVYGYNTLKEVAKKQKDGTMKDPMTGEPFGKHDIITLQDPSNTELRRIGGFRHIAATFAGPADEGRAEIRGNALYRITVGQLDGATELVDNHGKIFKGVEKDALADRPRHARFTTSGQASSFTCTAVDPKYATQFRPMTVFEVREPLYALVKKQKLKAYVKLVTSDGDLNIMLHADRVPVTCDNFLQHCEDGYYDNTIFHRYVPNFIIQGGDPTGTGRGGESAFYTRAKRENRGEDVPKYFKDEFDNTLYHVGAGVVSMANKGKHTNGSQFFITFNSCDHLDNRHTVFGRLVGGRDVLRKWSNLKIDDDERPKNPPKLVKCVVYSNPFEAVAKQVREQEEEEAANLKRRQCSTTRNWIIDLQGQTQRQAAPGVAAAPGVLELLDQGFREVVQSAQTGGKLHIRRGARAGGRGLGGGLLRRLVGRRGLAIPVLERHDVPAVRARAAGAAATAAARVGEREQRGGARAAGAVLVDAAAEEEGFQQPGVERQPAEQGGGDLVEVLPPRVHTVAHEGQHPLGENLVELGLDDRVVSVRLLRLVEAAEELEVLVEGAHAALPALEAERQDAAVGVGVGAELRVRQDDGGQLPQGANGDVGRVGHVAAVALGRPRVDAACLVESAHGDVRGAGPAGVAVLALGADEAVPDGGVQVRDEEAAQVEEAGEYGGVVVFQQALLAKLAERHGNAVVQAPAGARRAVGADGVLYGEDAGGGLFYAVLQGHLAVLASGVAPGQCAVVVAIDEFRVVGSQTVLGAALFLRGGDLSFFRLIITATFVNIILVIVVILIKGALILIHVISHGLFHNLIPRTVARGFSGQASADAGGVVDLHQVAARRGNGGRVRRRAAFAPEIAGSVLAVGNTGGAVTRMLVFRRVAASGGGAAAGQLPQHRLVAVVGTVARPLVRQVGVAQDAENNRTVVDLVRGVHVYWELATPAKQRRVLHRAGVAARGTCAEGRRQVAIIQGHPRAQDVVHGDQDVHVLAQREEVAVGAGLLLAAGGGGRGAGGDLLNAGAASARAGARAVALLRNAEEVAPRLEEARVQVAEGWNLGVRVLPNAWRGRQGKGTHIFAVREAHRVDDVLQQLEAHLAPAAQREGREVQLRRQHLLEERPQTRPVLAAAHLVARLRDEELVEQRQHGGRNHSRRKVATASDEEARCVPRRVAPGSVHRRYGRCLLQVVVRLYRLGEGHQVARGLRHPEQPPKLHERVVQVLLAHAELARVLEHAHVALDGAQHVVVLGVLRYQHHALGGHGAGELNRAGVAEQVVDKPLLAGHGELLEGLALEAHGGAGDHGQLAPLEVLERYGGQNVRVDAHQAGQRDGEELPVLDGAAEAANGAAVAGEAALDCDGGDVAEGEGEAAVELGGHAAAALVAEVVGDGGVVALVQALGLAHVELLLDHLGQHYLDVQALQRDLGVEGGEDAETPGGHLAHPLVGGVVALAVVQEAVHGLLAPAGGGGLQEHGAQLGHHALGVGQVEDQVVRNEHRAVVLAERGALADGVGNVAHDVEERLVGRAVLLGDDDEDLHKVPVLGHAHGVGEDVAHQGGVELGVGVKADAALNEGAGQAVRGRDGNADDADVAVLAEEELSQKRRLGHGHLVADDHEPVQTQVGAGLQRQGPVVGVVEVVVARTVNQLEAALVAEELQVRRGHLDVVPFDQTARAVEGDAGAVVDGDALLDAPNDVQHAGSLLGQNDHAHIQRHLARGLAEAALGVVADDLVEAEVAAVGHVGVVEDDLVAGVGVVAQHLLEHLHARARVGAQGGNRRANGQAPLLQGAHAVLVTLQQEPGLPLGGSLGHAHQVLDSGIGDAETAKAVPAKELDGAGGPVQVLVGPGLTHLLEDLEEVAVKVDQGFADGGHAPAAHVNHVHKVQKGNAKWDPFVNGGFQIANHRHVAVAPRVN